LSTGDNSSSEFGFYRGFAPGDRSESERHSMQSAAGKTGQIGQLGG